MVFPLAAQEVEVEGVVVQAHSGDAGRVEQVAKDLAGFLAGEEQILVRGVGEVVARRNHGAFHSQVADVAEHPAQVVDVAVAKNGGVGAYPIAPGHGQSDAVNRAPEHAGPGHGCVVLFLHAVHMDDPAEVLGGGDFVQHSRQKQGVGAAIDEVFFGDQGIDDFVNMGVDGGFAAGDGDDGGAGVVDGGEGFGNGHHLV